jgi:hypothetical protein
MTDKLASDDEWRAAREVWAAGGVEILEEPNAGALHFLTDLRRAAGTYLAAREVTETDRERTPTLATIADQCRSLYIALERLDDVAVSRVTGSLPRAFHLGYLLAELASLESALRHARAPRVPRKRPQEHNDFLVVVLAGIYEKTAGRKASVTTNPFTDEREGPFVDFVLAFAWHFLGDETELLNPRSIQRALKARKDNPEPDPNS